MFMDMASPEQKKALKRLLDKGDNEKALDLVQRVTKRTLNREQPAAGLMAFDFDNTLVTSDSKVKVTHADGSVDELDPYEYARYKEQPGDEFDMSDFEKVKNPKKIERYQKVLRAAIKNPNTDVVIVTARGNKEVVAQYFKDIGITSGLKIKALNSAKPRAKYHYLKNKIVAGNYQDLHFFDDSPDNVETVGLLKQEFGPLGVRINTHLVPPKHYGREEPSAKRADLSQWLKTKIPNPETGKRN